jgi:hypothetical protein
MSPAASAAVPSATPTVVFVRPESPCDTSDYSVVVDERGRFIGNVAAGTQVVVPVSPGRHVFYSWSDRDLRFDKLPEFNPVAATRVDAVGTETHYVALLVESRGSVVSRCYPYAVVSMQPVTPGDELQEWLQSTQLLVPNQEAGQLALRSNSALLQTHLELGRAKLDQIDYATAKKARRDAERAAGAD